MSTKLFGLVPYIRDATVGRAIASLSDCDFVLVRHGELGEVAARNALLDSVPTGAVVRFCDDDDVASNTRTMFDSLGDASVIAASYRIKNQNVVQVPDRDALIAAANYVGPWNWVARMECLRKVRDRFGSFFDGTWTCNTGARFWLRMIDSGLSFRFLPDVMCYDWNRGTPGSKSSDIKNDHALYEELVRRGVPGALVAARKRFDAKAT